MIRGTRSQLTLDSGPLGLIFSHLIILTIGSHSVSVNSVIVIVSVRLSVQGNSTREHSNILLHLGRGIIIPLTNLFLKKNCQKSVRQGGGYETAKRV